MSLWGVHIGVAGIVTVVALFVVAPGTRVRGVVVAASGLWAILPDFHHALDAFPRLQAQWFALHRSPLADLFWLHRTIDRVDPRDRVAFSLAMWTLFFAVVVATEFILRRRRRAETFRAT